MIGTTTAETPSPLPDQDRWSGIRGFNYQPSWASSDLEVWLRYDPAAADREIARGRRYFPHANTLRIWLSWAAFIRGHNRFTEAFEAALSIADRHGFRVIPVLTNRWHDHGTDWGGIYIDHFLPGASWVQSEGMWARYIEGVVAPHADDPRILIWDLCNEPFAYTSPIAEMPPVIVDSETAWLGELARLCRAAGAVAPIGTSVHSLHGLRSLELVEPFSDILLIHPYGDTDGSLDASLQFARHVGKPMLATETCWGAVDDEERERIIRTSLAALKERGLGWTVHILHHSLVSDAHRPQFGSIDRPGFHFIEADGALRPRHEAFNDY